jgi:hypothetical protein
MDSIKGAIELRELATKNVAAATVRVKAPELALPLVAWIRLAQDGATTREASRRRVRTHTFGRGAAGAPRL